MRRRGTVGLGIVVTTVAGMLGCAALAGLDSYESGVADAAAADASAGDAPAADGAASDSPAVDAPPLPSCGDAFVCYEPLTGWTGPFELAEVDPLEAGPPSCPLGAASVYDGLGAPAIPDASCSCACSTGTCGATVALYDDQPTGSNCLGPPCNVAPLGAGDCVGVAVACRAATIIGTEISFVDAACSATPASQVPDAGFGTTGRACASIVVDAGGACPAGSECVAVAPSPFEPAVCVMSPGDVGCPAGSSYGKKHVFYQGVVDTRACSPCACSTGAAACTFAVTLYQQTGCTGSSTATSAGPTCNDVQPNFGTGSVELTATFDTASCTTDGGFPTGSAAPNEPVTFCCSR